MTAIRDSLEAFVQGRLDFSGLLEAVTKATAENPAQIPELIDSINALYRSGRLPPQIYGALLARAGQGHAPDASSTDKSGLTEEESDRTRIAQPQSAHEGQDAAVTEDADHTRIATERPVLPPSIPDEADRTRIAMEGTSPAPPTEMGKEDRTRITTQRPASTEHGEEDQTRITTQGPSFPTSTESAEEDRTRIATDLRTGARTQPPTAQTSGSHPSSASSWTTGTDTSSRNISHEPSVGDVLKGRFVLEQELGRGGMGLVFKALDQRKVEARDRHPYVALKLLNESFKQHAESLMALQREARKAQDLKHPNVINIFDFDKDEHDNYFIAMELLVGHPLDKIIKSMRGIGMPHKKALRLISQMGQALGAAHNHKPGIIHSDFKPGNVFLTPDDEVKVFDFGIARAAKPKSGDLKGDVTAFDARTLGALTPTYASLEMLEGLDPDPRDDIYALAIVAYELLSGNRPFGRTPANEAMTMGLTPQKIQGLTRRQWKGLQRGLAFKREDRSARVEDFLDELRFRKSKAPLFLAASGVGLGVLSWLLIPPYLEKRREGEVISAIEQASPKEFPSLLRQSDDLPEASRENVASKVMERLINLVSSGQAKQVSSALEALDSLPVNIRKDVLTNAKNTILSFYIEQADAAFAPAAERYNFNAAEQLLSRVRELYPDSIQVFRTEQRMEEGKNDLLNDLDGRFNQHLSDGRLLPDPVEDDIVDVLEILKQLEPNHKLLSDTRLSDAYASQAASFLELGDFAQAELFSTGGMARFPDDPVLNNIQSKIRIAREQEQARSMLASLRERIEQRLPKLSTLDDYLDIGDDLSRLKSISQEDPLLTQAETGLRKLLDRQISRLIDNKEWLEAERLLQAYSTQLSPSYLEIKKSSLAYAHNAHEKKINDLFNSLTKAIADGRLSKPKGKNAIALLEKARTAAPADPRIERNLASIAQAYLDLSRKARANGEWEQARGFVQQGLVLKSPDPVTDSLLAENNEIDKAAEDSLLLLASAEREKREADRQAKIRGIYDEFDQRLSDMSLSVAEGRKLLGTLDRLAALNPTDPLLDEGRKRIAAQFDTDGQRLSQSGEWSSAIALISKGIEVIPESNLLAQRLKQLQQGFENQLRTDREGDIRERKTDIENLLAAPSFTKAWNDQLQASIESLEGLLSKDDTWIGNIRERAGQLYLQQASLERTKQQYAKAGLLLQTGKRFTPQLKKAFAQERTALTADERAWEAENQERAKLARLEGAKQSLLTQAKANDIKTAIKTLESLKGELTANDKFLTRTGPEAIGSAYLRLAERRAKRMDFNAAIKLLQNGLETAPRMASLQGRLTQYQDEMAIQEVRTALQKTQPSKVNRLQNSLKTLQKQFPNRYPEIADEFAGILAKRIGKIQEDKQAQLLLNSAKDLFPANTQLAKISIKPPTKPAIIAGKGLKATKSGQLRQAQQLLKQAEKKERGHPDVALLKETLKQKITSAEATYKKHLKALKANKPKQARAYVEQAIAIWGDNKTYKKKLTELDKPPPPPPPKVKDKCNPKYAGYGKRSSKFRCYDILQGKQKGPILVVVPAGEGSKTPYAIGRYEISIGDYNTYCQLSGNCKPFSGKNSKLPLSGISLDEAQNYARWLSQKTGSTYRLPSKSEWTHAARAKGSQPPASDFNCLLMSGGSVVKGGAPVHVNVAPQNAWGLFNYIGNVQEWVISNGTLEAVGGHYDDSAGNCSTAKNRSHNGKGEKVSGFRLLREIRG